MAKRVILSGSTNGRPIDITDTATAGQVLHTAHATDVDCIWIWLSNASGSSIQADLEWGVALSMQHEVPANSTIPLVEGWRLSNGDTVAIFVSNATGMAAQGHVNRLST